ncbi:MAG TPA: DoxX family protein [Roseiarcus sp.]|nr:DoxX family protein [Roseiarcus sp.]
MSTAFPSRPAAPATPKLQVWAAWTLTALFVLFMIFDIVIKLLRLEVVAKALAELGYPDDLGFMIGALETILLALYLIPRTSALGAVLFTGLFGGAIASHLRIGSPIFTHDLFGVYLGLFAWGGLWLRDEKLRAVFPFRR